MAEYEDLTRYGPLTRDAVRVMIYDAITAIEEKRELQHKENLARFDKQDAKQNMIIGVILFVGGLVPVIAHYLPR